MRRMALWAGLAAATAACAQAPSPAFAQSDRFGHELADALVGAFDQERAFADLVRQVEMGPRLPGSRVFLEWIESELEAIGLEGVRRQGFLARNALTGADERGANVIAFHNRGAASLVLLSCHWDCRHRADRDPDPANRRLPVPGANDGASGVAALLEIARALQAHPLPEELGVMFVFFDAEDQGVQGDAETFCQGSLYFAQHFDPSLHVVAAINLDMIGDADLALPIERHSREHAPDVVDALWSHGEALFPAHFNRGDGGYIFDDHVRLQRIGLPAINVIDFDYPAWHTTGDAPEACSPDSLRVAGAAVLSYLGFGARPYSF